VIYFLQHSVDQKYIADAHNNPENSITWLLIGGNWGLVVKVDRRIRWHYTTTILHLRIGARGIEIVNFTTAVPRSPIPDDSSRYARTISRHADGISRYSVPPSAGPLLPLLGPTASRYDTSTTERAATSGVLIVILVRQSSTATTVNQGFRVARFYVWSVQSVVQGTP